MAGARTGDGSDYVVAALVWVCENRKLTFTLSFNRDYQLIGIDMK